MANVPFGVRDAHVYLSGQSAAKSHALANGFFEESMVELPVLWGEQVSSRLLPPHVGADTGLFNQEYQQLTVQPRSQDPNSHVNNSVFFRYLEAGRIAFIRSFTSNLLTMSSSILSGTGKGIILGEVTNKYLVSPHRLSP